MNEEREEKQTPTKSYSDYHMDNVVSYIAHRQSEAIFGIIQHEIETPRIILFFEHRVSDIKSAYHKVRSMILDTIYKHERVVKTRLAGSMMTIDEAMSRGTKCKTLREFADWFYKLWAEWDKNFNWLEVNTFQYSDTPDNRIGWRQTWLVTAPGGSDSHTYPVAFTDKPFYNLKLNAADIKYIRSKYPKLLECVDDLRHGGHRRENELYRKEMTKKYGEH